MTSKVYSKGASRVVQRPKAGKVRWHTPPTLATMLCWTAKAGQVGREGRLRGSENTVDLLE